MTSLAQALSDAERMDAPPVTTVVAVIASGLYAGPHNIVAYWAKRLTARGIRVVVVLPPEPGGAAEILEKAGAKVRIVALSRVRRNPVLALKWLVKLIPDTLRLKEVLHEEQADVVAVMRTVDFQAALAGKLSGVRVVWHVLDSAPPLWLRAFAGRLMRLMADQIPAMSPTIARMHGLEGHRKVSYIGPPSDADVFRPTSPPRQKRGEKPRLTVGVIAQLTPMKGIEHFARAAASVAERIPEAQFIVVGGESAGHEAYARNLRSEVAELRLESRFSFVGPRYDLPEVFAELDVLVIASKERSEGLPTVMLNAIMAGVPVVATAVGGIPDVIEHEVTGILVLPGDVDALADSLTNLLQNPTLRTDIASTALRTVAPRYDMPAWEQAYVEVFDGGSTQAEGSHTW